jgi:TRAP-type uncharacterized transport system fused permease subunit
VTVTQERAVTRADIEAKLRQIRGGVDSTARAAVPIGLAVGTAAVAIVVGVAYLMGRRRGRKRATVVEIRRV